MKDDLRAFDDFSDRMADQRSCVVMRDYIAHFANPIRLKLLCLLVRGEGLCVSDLVERTGEKQSTVSQQLRQLQMARLVDRERKGNRVFYAVADPVVEETMRFFASIAKRVDPVRGRGPGG
jgi:ArsR family transcriptional regulator